MILENEKGRPVIINGQHIVAVSPAYDESGQPVIGMTTLLTDLPPPNVPGAGPTQIVVKGSYQEIAIGLGLHCEPTTLNPGDSE